MQSTSPSPRSAKFSFKEACNHSASSRPLSTTEKSVVSTFLVIFFFTVGSWLLPDWIPFKGAITRYTWPVMASTGWIQYWSLFCPEVRNIIYHTNALIEFQDGTIKCYEFPRHQKMDLLTRFGREKLRKLFGDNIPWPGYEQFRPSIARYLARANADPTNPPKRITFVFNSCTTPAPQPKTFCYRDQLPEHTNKGIFFIYDVQPQDLELQ